MLNPDLEINRLRWTLQDRGFNPIDVDVICRSASNEITDSILDIVAGASSEAVSYAESIGATNFFADIDVVPDGYSFAIKTRSGNTDYSIDHRENLANLLKSGKTAPDGSKYKVIPIKDKPKMGTSTFVNMRDQNKAAQAARQALKDKQATVSERAHLIANQMRQSMSTTIAERKKQDTGGTTHFKTASSKQDASKDWVIPEINRDMTQYLQELNDNIKISINDMIEYTVNRYSQEYS